MARRLILSGITTWVPLLIISVAISAPLSLAYSKCDLLHFLSKFQSVDWSIKNLVLEEYLKTTCPSCPSQLNVTGVTLGHSVSHFRMLETSHGGDLKDTLKRYSRVAGSTQLFPPDVQQFDALNALKSGKSWRLHERSLQALKENKLAEEELISYLTRVQIHGRNYEVVVVLCQKARCANGNEVLQKGDILSIIPQCGPGVVKVSQPRTKLKGEIEVRTSIPCK